jgi:hypothetical protein
MKFSGNFPSNISIEKYHQANSKLTELLLELGVREDNQHVGSGLGGNNYQLFSLLGIEHTLGHLHTGMIVSHDAGIFWDAETIEFSSRVDMRKKVDTMFPLIEERYPEAVAFAKDWSTHAPIREQIQLIDAMTICKELAVRLDKGDTSFINDAWKYLRRHSPEVILVAVRKQITLERIVNHNLDEHPVFGKLLTTINKTVG